MKASQLLSLGAVTGILAGTAFAQVAPPPIPVGWHLCRACHTDDPTLCDEKWCPPGSACGKQEGETDGMLWVRVVCLTVH